MSSENKLPFIQFSLLFMLPIAYNIAIFNNIVLQFSHCGQGYIKYIKNIDIMDLLLSRVRKRLDLKLIANHHIIGIFFFSRANRTCKTRIVTHHKYVNV